MPAAITGIGTASQVRFMSSNVPAPYGPAPRDLGAHEHKLHSDLEVPSFDDYRRSSTKDPTKKSDDAARKTFTYSMTAGVGMMGTYTAMKIVSSLVGSLMPNKALAMGQIEVSVDGIPEGKNMVFNFQGKPLFVRRRYDIFHYLVNSSPFFWCGTKVDHSISPSIFFVMLFKTNFKLPALG